MDFQYLYTSFDGRIGRQSWWLGVIVLIVAMVIVISISLFIPFIGIILIAIAYLAALFASVAMGLKRLHDRNKDGTLLWVFIGVPIAVQAITWLFSLQTSALGMLLAAISFAASIWGLIELGILKGTEGPNDYGPDPLQ